ncbi:hypothetical protein AC578_3699 [Pseudocercospora eumusae]|uniref:Sulfotransferase domain-containing protein n=1 Tax=Pseudocercospora eumusae TaxID=321146 RepID=A0A139HSR0_9PEZI|nr:hypothetical protein AC578_3699 [Pseudocercospora eumusae]
MAPSTWELLFGFSQETKQRHPHLFIDHKIDRRGAKRMSRTGTASMQAALRILGYPTSHGFDMHENPKDAAMWLEGFETKYFNASGPPHLNTSAHWDQLLGHVSATTDLPANCFGPELMKAYPNAKVILVERDIEAWFKTFENAVITGQDHPIATAIMSPLDSTGMVSKLSPVVNRGVMQGQFHSKDSVEWRRNARQVYRRHYAEIRECLKDEPERLLEYELGSGWEPICEFLGKPVPDVPFPRINESAMHDEMLRVIGFLLLRAAVCTLMVWSMPVIVAIAAWRYMR